MSCNSSLLGLLLFNQGHAALGALAVFVSLIVAHRADIYFGLGRLLFGHILLRIFKKGLVTSRVAEILNLALIGC